MIRLTKTGIFFISLMGLLYLSSMQSQSGLLFFIIGILFGCFVINAYLAYRSLKYLEVTFPFAIKMMETEKSRVAIGIRNLSDSPQGMIEIKSSYGRILNMGVLNGGEQVHLFPEVSFDIRGVYPFGKFKIMSDFPFGLIRFSRQVDHKGEFVVFPKVYQCYSPPAGGFEPMLGGAFTGKHKSVSGSHFAGIRPFTSDDSFKNIHWKSSAKGSGLMVKEFSEELSGRISIILDQTLNSSSSKGEETTLDTAVRVTGSLTLAALDIGHHVDVIPVKSNGVTSFPPFADGTALLDMLARLEGFKKQAPGLQELRKAADSGSKRSAVCFIMTAPNDALPIITEQLLDERRKVSVMLPAEWDEIPDFPAGVKVRRFNKHEILY